MAVSCLSCEVVTAKITVFWYMTQCTLQSRQQRFGVTCCRKKQVPPKRCNSSTKVHGFASNMIVHKTSFWNTYTRFRDTSSQATRSDIMTGDSGWTRNPFPFALCLQEPASGPYLGPTKAAPTSV